MLLCNAVFTLVVSTGGFRAAKLHQKSEMTNIFSENLRNNYLFAIILI